MVNDCDSVILGDDFFKNIFKMVNDGIIIADVETNLFFEVNEKICEITGFEHDELVGKGLDFIHPKEDLGYVREQFESQKTGEINIARSIPVKNKEGEVSICDVNSIPIEYNGKKYLVGIFRDITDLRDTSREYEDLFNNMLNGFASHKMIYDKDGKPVDYIFLNANNAFELLTGLKVKEVIGRRVTEVIPGIERDKADWINKYANVAENGGSLYFEEYSEALNLWYSVKAFSQKKGFFAVIIDNITKFKSLEFELRSKISELERFQKIAVDRELKMVELKEKVETLSERIAELEGNK